MYLIAHLNRKPTTEAEINYKLHKIYAMRELIKVIDVRQLSIKFWSQEYTWNLISVFKEIKYRI